MHREMLIDIGRALYGDGWIKPLCADCGWSPRFMERIRDGQNEAPEFIKPILLELLFDKIRTIGKLRNAATPERLEKLNARLEEIEGVTRRFSPKAFEPPSRISA